MLNRYLQLGRDAKSDFVAKLIFSLGLVYLLGPVVVSLKANMPITLQTLILLFVAIGFGWRIGTIVSVVYVVSGMLGLPVFAGYVGGMAQITSAFGGFFFGFIAAAMITGFIAEGEGMQRPIPCFLIWVLGHVIVLLMGGFWLHKLNPESWWQMIQFALPGAAVKSAIGFLLIQVVIRLKSKREDFYAKK